MNGASFARGPALNRGLLVGLAAIITVGLPCAEADTAMKPFFPAGRLLNISTRARVGTGDNVLIAGFTVVGSEPKKVIVRALGPSLIKFGVPDALADTVLELHDGAGSLLMSNDDWQETQRTELEEAQLAPADEREAAIVRTLEPGAYTAIVRGSDDATGVALVEVYDGDRGSSSELANVSTRAFVSPDSPLIGGVIVSDEGVPFNRVIVRALGPSLGAFGVPQTLADPTLELRDGGGVLLQKNDDWEESERRDSIVEKGLAPGDEREAAILSALGPGAFTAIVRGTDDEAGAALVEFYH